MGSFPPRTLFVVLGDVRDDITVIYSEDIHREREQGPRFGRQGGGTIRHEHHFPSVRRVHVFPSGDRGRPRPYPRRDGWSLPALAATWSQPVCPVVSTGRELVLLLPRGPESFMDGTWRPCAGYTAEMQELLALGWCGSWSVGTPGSPHSPSACGAIHRGDCTGAIASLSI